MKYFIYSKFKGQDQEWLSGLANTKAQGIERLQELAEYGQTARLVPLKKILGDCKSIDEKICKILDVLDVNTETYERKGKHFSVEIVGDWKHEHLFIQSLLAKIFKCNLIDSKVTWDGDGDCYAAIHTFCL